MNKKEYKQLKKKVLVLLKSPFLLAQNILGRVPFKPVYIARFFILELENITIKKFRGFGTIREGNMADAEEMSTLAPKDKQTFVNRFESGEHCVVAVYKEKIVGYEWFSDKESHFESQFKYNIVIPLDCVYTYDAFILPQFRIRGIWVLFQKYILEKMEQLDKQKVIAMVEYGNEISLRTHKRFGFQVYKEVFFLKVFHKRFFKENNIAKK